MHVAGRRLSQAAATAGHQWSTCWLVGSPKPQRGHGPYGLGLRSNCVVMGAGGGVAQGRSAATGGSRDASQRHPSPAEGASRQREHQATPGWLSAGVVHRQAGSGQEQEAQRHGKQDRTEAERAPARPRRPPDKTLVA